MARNVQIELGDVIPSAQQQIIKDLKKEDMAQTELTMSVRDRVNEFIESGIEFYWGEDGYNYDLEVGNEYNFPAGMYSFDAPLDEYDQITKWVYVGAGKIVVSNEKNADGSWVLKTILDGDGLGTDTVGANNILADSITTDHIATDVLTASNIQMSGGETLQTYINEASETHRDILPPSNAKKDDVWVKPKMQVKDLRDINMLELRRYGVTVSELLGGGVYVATVDVSSSNFNNWVKIASDETFARGGITNIENGLVEVVKYGDLATAGRTVIDGNNIKTGRIQDELEANYIDLDVGEINFGQGDFTYSPNEGMQIAGFNVTKDGLETITYEPFVNDYTIEDMDKIEQYIRGRITLTPSEFQRLDVNGDSRVDIADMATIEQFIRLDWKDLLLAKRILLNPMGMTISITSAIIRENGEVVRQLGGTEITQSSLDATHINTGSISFQELMVGARTGIDAKITVDGKEYEFRKGILIEINDI